MDTLAKYKVAEEANFFLLKMTLFQVDKQAVFLKFFKTPLNGFHITLADVFGISQNIIKIYNNENIKFLYYNFVDIALKANRGIKKTKKHNLVFKKLYHI